MGGEIWKTIVSEFSDISDIATITRITLRFSLAAVLGGVLGYERELKARSAGVRTHMLVAVGAALFVIGPLQSGIALEDMSRILQGIIQGIGFLGGCRVMERGRAVDDRDAAQGARRGSIPGGIDPFGQRGDAPCRPPPYGFGPESRDAALRNPVDTCGYRPEHAPCLAAF